MGFLPPTITLLAELHRDVGLEGPVVTLGNQDVYASAGELRAKFRDVGCRWCEPRAIDRHTSDLFKRAFPDRTRDYVHARTLFSMLGIDEYEDLDAYEFDLPSIVHDLNTPVPEALRERFRLVIDGGTIEHIFDLRSCFQNMVAMSMLGGRIIHWNSASNMVDHGFWAINPSMYFDFYDANGFGDLSATLFEWDTRDPWRPCTAIPYEYGMMINGLTDPERALMVWFTATKTREAELTVPVQGLYQQGRRGSFSGGAWAPVSVAALPRRVL